MNKDLQNKIYKAVEAISPLYDPDSDHVTIRLVEEDLSNKISDIAQQARNEALEEALEVVRDAKTMVHDIHDELYNDEIEDILQAINKLKNE